MKEHVENNLIPKFEQYYIAEFEIPEGQVV